MFRWLESRIDPFAPFDEGRTPPGSVPAFLWHYLKPVRGWLGVLFVAAGSWLIPRIGASMTALLVIAGQMVSGALIDAARGAEGAPLRALGVAVILAGVILARGRR